MNIEKKIFEKEGLKIDEERILTYSKLGCPLDCKYCFVGDLEYNQEKDVPYLTSSQLELLEKAPKNISQLMLGCDTEFFQDKDGALKILDKLSSLNKDISVITKLSLSKNFIKQLKEIDNKLRRHKNFMSFSISLSSIESSEKWEPKVPSPQKRIETLKRAHLVNLETLVALRPLLPDVSVDELEHLVIATKDYCFGYYSGPLYLKKLDRSLVDLEDHLLKIEKVQPYWMPDNNIFYKIEKIGQMESLKKILEQYNKPLFKGASEAMKYLKKYEKS